MGRDLDTARATGSHEQRGSFGRRKCRQGEAEFIVALVPKRDKIGLIGPVDSDKSRSQATSHRGPASPTDDEVRHRAIEPGAGRVWVPTSAGFREQLHKSFLGDIFGQLRIPRRSQCHGVGHRRMYPMGVRDVVVGGRYCESK